MDIRVVLKGKYAALFERSVEEYNLAFKDDLTPEQYLMELLKNVMDSFEEYMVRKDSHSAGVG